MTYTVSSSSSPQCLMTSIGMQVEITLAIDADFVSCYACPCSWKVSRERRISYPKVYDRHSWKLSMCADCVAAGQRVSVHARSETQTLLHG